MNAPKCVMNGSVYCELHMSLNMCPKSIVAMVPVSKVMQDYKMNTGLVFRESTELNEK